MATGITPTEAVSGYLSPESKRRFTLVAGILGAVFFFAQFLLPMLAMFLLVMPTFLSSVAKTAAVEDGALWRGELWFVERSTGLEWNESAPNVRRSLRHVRLEDLASAGPAIPFELGGSEEPSLLAVGDRLWLIGSDAIAYYEGGVVTKLAAVSAKARATRAFAFQGRLSRITLGTPSRLVSLETEGSRAEWRATDLPLNLPPERGSLDSLQAVETGGRLLLFAELCTGDPQRCSLVYREASAETWLPLIDDACSCLKWSAVAMGQRPGVVASERESGRGSRLSAYWVTPGGVEQQRIDLEQTNGSWYRWRALSQEDRLFLVTERMPGSIQLAEVADGHVARSVKTGGDFPFGRSMVFLMLIPQLLPVLLSLALALVLTSQMRKHRVPDYVYAGQRRRFASVWQRALAQLVDAVGLAAGFAIPGLCFGWRMFSDPDDFVGRGPAGVLWVFGLMAVALVSSLLVLVGYSYWEGLAGKTPGKWLLGIRVLGTDLRPCGFGRALLRNLLTFVDGFFNFLVGVLLVALTDNWQRLGDLVARTIVVVDEKST
jgi:uncharacterized RDD family membrane protein YckC